MTERILGFGLDPNPVYNMSILHLSAASMVFALNQSSLTRLRLKLSFSIFNQMLIVISVDILCMHWIYSQSYKACIIECFCQMSRLLSFLGSFFFLIIIMFLISSTVLGSASDLFLLLSKSLEMLLLKSFSCKFAFCKTILCCYIIKIEKVLSSRILG